MYTFEEKGYLALLFLFYFFNSDNNKWILLSFGINRLKYRQLYAWHKTFFEFFFSSFWRNSWIFSTLNAVVMNVYITYILEVSFILAIFYIQKVILWVLIYKTKKIWEMVKEDEGEIWGIMKFTFVSIAFLLFFHRQLF